MTFSTSVVRPSILRLAEHPWFRHLATVTRPGRAVASRFVAGETLDQAMAVSRELDRMRTTAMLDHLGENVETVVQATDARDAYLAALAAIRQEPTLDIAISLKLTQLGLDRSTDECLANVEPILDAADEQATLVMIDMEAHQYVASTLEVARAVHARHPRVGVAMQSYLRRSATDVFDLPAGMRVRLVKGSYLEPPDVVFTQKRDVDRSFRRLFATLFARGHAIDVATHDPPHARSDPLDGRRGRRWLVTGGVPDAVRCAPGPAGGPRAAGVPGSGLHPVRHRVVPVSDATARRTACEHVVLRHEPVARSAGDVRSER